MRRQCSRNRAPSAVSVMLRVLRWRRRTRSRSSIRATALPIADDDTPSCRPATVKLRASAARTKAFSDPRLSIRGPSIADNRVRYVWTYGPLFKLRKPLSLAHVNAFVFLGLAPASSIAPQRPERRRREGRLLIRRTYRPKLR